MLPLLFWDERYSTVAVEKRMIKEGNIPRSKRNLYVDKSAATWILEGAIQTLKNINT
jgi:putative Holliday junction resolvase